MHMCSISINSKNFLMVRKTIPNNVMPIKTSKKQSRTLQLCRCVHPPNWRLGRTLGFALSFQTVFGQNQAQRDSQRSGQSPIWGVDASTQFYNRFENLRFLLMVSSFRILSRAGKFENLRFLLMVFPFSIQEQENSKICVFCSWFLSSGSQSKKIRKSAFFAHSFFLQ